MAVISSFNYWHRRRDWRFVCDRNDMTQPTQAQIKAALKVLSKPDCCFCDTVCLILPCKCVESALTAAAAEAGQQDEEIKRLYRCVEAYRSELNHTRAATIERCAQKLDMLARTTQTTQRKEAFEIAAAAIRAMKEEG